MTKMVRDLRRLKVALGDGLKVMYPSEKAPITKMGKSLVAAHDESTERALWAALRALEENSALARRMAKRARERQSDLTAVRFDARGDEAEQNAMLVRELLMKRMHALSGVGQADEEA